MIKPFSIVLALSVSAIQFGYEVGSQTTSQAAPAPTAAPTTTADLAVVATTTAAPIQYTTNLPVTTAAPKPTQPATVPNSAPTSIPSTTPPSTQQLPKVVPQNHQPAPVNPNPNYPPKSAPQTQNLPVAQNPPQTQNLPVASNQYIPSSQNLPVASNQYNPNTKNLPVANSYGSSQNLPTSSGNYNAPSNNVLPQVTSLPVVKPKCNRQYATMSAYVQTTDSPIAATGQPYMVQTTDSPIVATTAQPYQAQTTDSPVVATSAQPYLVQTTDSPIAATADIPVVTTTRKGKCAIKTTDAAVVATPTAQTIMSTIDPNDLDFNGVRIYNNVTAFSSSTLQVTIVSNILPPISNISHYTFDINGKLSQISGDEIYAQVVSTIPIFASTANWYPFDTYDALIVASCKEAEIAFLLNGAVDAWRTDFQLLDEGERFMYLQVTLTRTFVTTLFSIFVNLMMWILSLSAIYLSVTACTRRRKIEPPMIAGIAALLFALPNIRNVQPGLPAIGCTADIAGFFPAMLLVGFSVVILMWNYILNNHHEKQNVSGSEPLMKETPRTSIFSADSVV
ncbi:hypothetical protein HDV04_001127 [Boothiomyces sp. JEL0838]|nr:hypothetical protein HDV04_001127 [Boothiomyces sp. JEL0838]